MRKVITEFFLDGAKIIFGSMVVGFFAPNIYGLVPWRALMAGIMATVAFLILSSLYQEKK